MILMVSSASLLFAIKFVVLPILEWQNERLVSINLESKRLAKLSLASENIPQASASLTQYQTANAKLADLFFNQEPSFQLKRQQQLEKTLERFSLSAQRFGWSEAISLEKQNVIKYRADMQLKGRFVDFLRWHIEIGTLAPVIQVERFSLRRNRVAKGKLGLITVDVNLAFYAREAL